MIKEILFLFFIIIKCLFASKYEAIPKENGILNSKYSHKSDDNLFFVFEHFRHGARSTCEGKIENYTDILGGKWKDSGGLTKIGKIQHYIIGAKNKLRYKNFINNEYDPKEIKIYSTDYIRTINSAQMQLLGLYHNLYFYNISNDDIIGEEKIDVNLNSIIPAINLLIYKKDKFEIIYNEKFKCPIFKENINKNKKELYDFETMNNIRNNFNKKYYDVILNEFKLNDTKTHEGMYNFCDAFITNFYEEDYNRLKLNEIEMKNKNFNLTDILNICYDYYKEYFFNIEGERHAKINGILSMSKTIQKTIDIMRDRINNGTQKYISYKSPKLLLYSGHDDTLTQMQMLLKNAFKIEYEWVPYASTQLFELRKYGNIFYVEIYYNDRLKLNLTFDDFEKILRKKIMSEEDIYNKCYSFRYSYYFNNIFRIIIILFFIFLLYIIIRIYLYRKKMKIKKYKKSILNIS